ncbi:MAG: cupin-like domain-containing protein [Bacteroidetes bacterium]|nr:cupin-like domain-containing protein [Bacteroidota bacterium]
MQVQSIDRVDDISPTDFRERYLLPSKPVVIRNLAHQWNAINKWTWQHFKDLVGEVNVPVYNNTRAGAKVPVNGGDGFMKFGEYIDLISKGPSEWRIFLFNLFKHAPQLKNDFTFPDQYMKGFLKSYPMLFVGGAGSIAHMHYDIDLAHIFHTQFIGRKRVLLLGNKQSTLIYKMPSTVESAASFVNWHEGLDYEHFPALQHAKAYTTILEHGDTLFMPSAYWHHMQYMDSGFAMSLRAMPVSVSGKLNALYHIFGMRGFNNMLIKMAPGWWYKYKRKIAHKNANKAMRKLQSAAL